MRILYWTQQFHPYIGGVEVLGTHFLRALAGRGHEPVVVTSHGSLELPDDDEWEGIPVHRRRFAAALTSGEAGPVAEAIAEVGGLKRALRPDLVHLNLTDPSGFFHLRTRAAHPCPSVVSVRVSVDGGGPTSLLAELLRSADQVTAVSEAALASAVAACPEVADRGTVILNALPSPGIVPEPVAVHPPVLVGAGRLVGDKGFDVAVRALARLRPGRPGLVLRLAGDGPEREPLLALARELGVDDAVELLGWVPPGDLPELLAGASVVVMPSRWQEAYGLVALQAAQVGRPVVATRTGGLPEVVADGETGLLVPVDDDGAIASAVASLLDDPARAEQMGEAARRRAADRFDFERYVDEHLAVYRALTGVR